MLKPKQKPSIIDGQAVEKVSTAFFMLILFKTTPR